jgi:hypothetical protein
MSGIEPHFLGRPTRSLDALPTKLSNTFDRTLFPSTFNRRCCIYSSVYFNVFKVLHLTQARYTEKNHESRSSDSYSARNKVFRVNKEDV